MNICTGTCQKTINLVKIICDRRKKQIKLILIQIQKDMSHKERVLENHIPIIHSINLYG